MTVLDSSVLIAILKNEAERAILLEVLAQQAQLAMSAVNLVEVGIVLRNSKYGFHLALVQRLLDEFGVVVHPVTSELAWAAIDADQRFGKGIHPARLNFGDCFAYALAKALDAPLLFKGDDFAKTDVRICNWMRI